jgi:hypothetical protein
MKKNYMLLLISFASLCLFSCQKNFEATATQTQVSVKPPVSVQSDTWEIAGTAVNAETTVSLAKNWNNSWTRTYPLAKGDLRFRACGGNKVVLGHNPSDKPTLLTYNGDAISIDAPGNYTVTLALTDSGNYIYLIEKIVFP